MANEVIKQVNLNSELYNIEDETSRGSIDELGTQVETLETKVTSLETLTPFDTAPTAASEKGVTSGGVKTAIDEVQSNLETFEASVKNTYSETSEDPISGKGVADALKYKIGLEPEVTMTTNQDPGYIVLKFPTVTDYKAKTGLIYVSAMGNSYNSMHLLVMYRVKKYEGQSANLALTIVGNIGFSGTVEIDQDNLTAKFPANDAVWSGNIKQLLSFYV